MRIQEFDSSTNVEQALLWQYNDASSLISLVQKKAQWYAVNQQEFWEDWFTNVFNLDTANEFGLSVWSIILDLPVFFIPDGDPNRPRFGFETAYKNFERSNLSNEEGGHDFGLTLEEKRLLLKMRYFQLTSNTATWAINQFYAIIFNHLGPTYVLDGFSGMFIVLVFKWPVPKRVVQAIKYFDLVPRGAGVGIRYVPYRTNIFGLEQYNKNFERGNFIE